AGREILKCEPTALFVAVASDVAYGKSSFRLRYFDFERFGKLIGKQTGRRLIAPISEEESRQFHQLAIDEFETDRVSVPFAAGIGHDPDGPHAVDSPQFTFAISYPTRSLHTPRSRARWPCTN